MTEPIRPKAKDLAVEEPCSMEERLGGYPWLPRILDKARASRAGTLGTYYRYPCPIDQAFLSELGVSAERFADLAETVPDPDILDLLPGLGACPASEFDFDPLAMNRDLHHGHDASSGS